MNITIFILISFGPNAGPADGKPGMTCRIPILGPSGYRLYPARQQHIQQQQRKPQQSRKKMATERWRCDPSRFARRSLQRDLQQQIGRPFTNDKKMSFVWKSRRASGMLLGTFAQVSCEKTPNQAQTVLSAIPLGPGPIVCSRPIPTAFPGIMRSSQAVFHNQYYAVKCI